MGRKKYTDEEIAERKARDAALAARADETLADPDATTQLVHALLTITSPRILGYSLRNQAMLMAQADERGTTLTDVDTLKGWRERGRRVLRGSVSYRIVQPRGAVEDGDGDGEEALTPVNQPDTGDPAETGTRRELFRMQYLFDISQTEGVDEEMPGYHPLTVADSTAALRATLADQLDRYGYAVVIGDVPAAVVNDDPPTVTVPDGFPVVELAHAVGALRSRPKDDRPRMRPREQPAESDAACITPDPARLTFDLGTYGTATARARAELTTGTVVYTVRAHRVAGAFTVHSHEAADYDTVNTATVRFGDWTHTDYVRDDRAPDLPTINSITVHGGCWNVSSDDVDRITHWRVHARRGDYGGTAAPDKTTQRAAAVVRAVLADWYARDDLAELHAARARYDAQGRKRFAEHVAATAAVRLAQATTEHAEAMETVERYTQLSAEPDVTQDT
ncbi:MULTISPECIES: hypothetical protein [unclassified Amycolatopsis]|uniref:hypothetical protein n=1 Tax=unclassified Amycolatopsis TaxID=2618356 RepID=UPI0028746D20|nr:MULTISPECIES: hypothetical protein [unclassified Amycolatopsis]MDS0140618.1 hypothetical protein [Amycolatopsis sp. 505]MDS0149268.1 hypothetical protein [Amycolatopsis sp. CM201R]